MNRRPFLFAASAVLAILSGCVFVFPITVPPQDVAVPSAPAYVQDAVAQFLSANPKWRVQWQPGSGSPRLTGPGLPIPGIQPFQGDAQDRATLVAAMDAVVATWGEQLGLRGLQTKFASGSRAGSVWFLHGTLERHGIPVAGRIDCGLSTTGLVVLMSSHVPPGAAALSPLTPQSTVKEAEASALAFAGLHAQDGARIGRIQTRLVVWWNAAVRNPPAPKLAFRVFVEPRPAVDSAGGTYLIDAHEPVLLQFLHGTHHLHGGSSAIAHGPVPADDVDADVARPAPGHGMPSRKIQVRASVRSGLGAMGATSYEPMPFLDLVWDPAGAAPQILRTDASGYVTIPAQSGVMLKTSLTGGWLAGMAPAMPFQAAAPDPREDGGMPTFDIVDVAGQTVQLERATIWYWLARANEMVSAIVVPLNELQYLGLLECSHGGVTECHAMYAEPTQLYFSTTGGTCPSWAFDTIILHEWAHALDYVCGGIHEAALAEAWADIVAMFLTRQPLIGLGFDGANSLRSGAVVRKPDDPVLQHGHAGEPLMGFAWQVRDKLIMKDGPVGEKWANSLFLGQVGGSPKDVSEFVKRVFLADDRDHDPATPSPNFELLLACCAAHGLLP